MDSVFRFHSIARASQGSYKEKGSKFLSFAFPVTSLADVQTKLQELRRVYHDASHHCYAWILGADKGQHKSHDDGEPRHSAGDPILGQIRSKGLTNVLVVVVRYFGGTKLGVGGLVGAYKQAAEDALSHAEIQLKFVTESIHIKYAYADTSAVMKIVNDFGIEIINPVFGEWCEATLLYKKEFEGQMMQALSPENQSATSVEVIKK